MTITSKICLPFRCKWVHPRFIFLWRPCWSVFCFLLLLYSLVFCLFSFGHGSVCASICVLFFINAAVSPNFYVIKKNIKQTKEQKKPKTNRLIFFALKRNTERIVSHQCWVTTFTIINWYIKYWLYLDYLAFQYFGFERYLMEVIKEALSVCLIRLSV